MIAGLKNPYLFTDPGPLDCLGKVAGLGSYEAVLAESQLAELPSGQIHLLRIGALIRAKETVGRPQDSLVVTQLKAIQERLATQQRI